MRLSLNNLLPNTAYAIQVRAKNSEGASEWSRRIVFSTVADEVLPSTPINVTWAVSGDAFHAEWDSVTSNVNGDVIPVTRYEVELVNAGVTKIVSVPQATGVKTTFDLSFEQNRALFGTPRASLTLRVRAVDNKELKSAWSNSVAATNPTPATPSSITGTAAVDSIQLKWASVADNDVIGYRVHVGTTSGFTPAEGNRIFSGLATEFNYASTTYSAQFFKVAAVDVFGQVSGYATSSAITPTSPFVVDTTPPPVPTNLAVTLVNNANGIGSRAEVTWTNGASTDQAGVEIAYKRTADAIWASRLIGKNDENEIIELQYAYTAYDFRIRAYDWSGNYSAYSSILNKAAVANTPPSTVSSMTAVAGRDAIRYSWPSVTDEDLREYEVTFSTQSNFTSPAIFRTGNANYLTVAGLNPGTTYYARVRAIDTAGLGSAAWSATNTTATLAYSTGTSDGVAPTSSPTATVSPGIGFLSVVWPAITNNDQVTYEVHMSTRSNFTPGAGTKVSEVSGTSTIIRRTSLDAELVYGTTYYVRIIAKDRDGAAAAGTQGSGTPTKAIIGDLNVTPTDLGVPSLTQYNEKITLLEDNDAAISGQVQGFGNYIVNTVNPAISAAQSTADGKNKVNWSQDAPVNGTSLGKVGDVWFVRNNSTGLTTAQYEATSENTWTARTLDSAVIANLTVSKLVGGTLSAIEIIMGSNGIIKSANYVAGTSGYQISETGIEVNNGTIKGSTIETSTLIIGQSNVTGLSSDLSARPLATTVNNQVANAKNEAMNADWLSNNTNFALWSNGRPNHFSATTGTGPTQETTLIRTSPFAVRWNIGAVQGYIDTGNGGSGLVNFVSDYIVLETDFMLVSGSINGSGILIDWNSQSAARSRISFADEVPSPTFNKWYRVTKVIKKPTNLAAAVTDYKVYLMANWSGHTGNVSTKDIIFDRLAFRPASAEEITAYNAPADATGKANAAKSEAISAAATDATTKAGNAQQAAISDSTTKYGPIKTRVEDWQFTGQTTINGGKIETDTVDTIQLNATAINAKHTITGALFQTSATANYGIKIASAGMNVYAANGTPTMTIDSATGSIAMLGTLTSGSKITGATVEGGTLLLSAGGIFRNANDSVIITESGITLSANATVSMGALQNNTTLSATGISMTGNISLTSGSGYIRGGGYTGTDSTTNPSGTGWFLGQGGLHIDNGEISASAIRAGNLGGPANTTSIINVLAGTSMVFNGGYLKSNTNTGTTYATAVTSGAGFYLGNDGLVIGGTNASINAAALVTGTISGTNTITLSGANARIVGTGFTLSGSGLTVTSGTVNAAALNITNSPNIVPMIYADFEAAPRIYENGQGYITVAQGSMIHGGSTNAIFNKGSLATVWGTNTSNPIVYLGASTTDYNIKVTASQAYIFSAYFWAAGTVATNAQFKVKWSNGTISTIGTATLAANGTPATATRITAAVAAPAGVTGAVLLVESSTLTNAAGFNMDGVMVQERNYLASTPTTWAPPGATAIDGAMVRTGAIQSNNPLSTGQPSWSISLGGAASFSALQVLGNTVLGLSGTDTASTISSANFVTGTTGWQIKATGAAEFNNIIVRGSATSAIISGARIQTSETETVGVKLDSNLGFITYRPAENMVGAGLGVEIPVSGPYAGSLVVHNGMHINGSTNFINNGGKLIALGQPSNVAGVFTSLEAGVMTTGTWVGTGFETGYPLIRTSTTEIRFEGSSSARGQTGFNSGSNTVYLDSTHGTMVRAQGGAMNITTQANNLMNVQAAGALTLQSLNSTVDMQSAAKTTITSGSAGTTIQSTGDVVLYGANVTMSTPNGGSISSARIAATTTSSAANMFINQTSGVMYRSTSSARYKTDIKTAVIDSYKILDIVPSTWLDKAEMLSWDETYETMPQRHFGAIAEQVHEIGLVDLVNYDEKNRPDSLDYSRMFLYALPMFRDMKDTNDELRAEISELRAMIEELKSLVLKS